MPGILYAFEKAVCRGSTACGKSDPSISEKTVQWAAVTGKIPQDLLGREQTGRNCVYSKRRPFMSFVILDEITKTYKMGEVEIHAVDHISFSIEKGEFVVIVGPSGAGKTTVLNTFWGEWIQQPVEN